MVRRVESGTSGVARPGGDAAAAAAAAAARRQAEEARRRAAEAARKAAEARRRAEEAARQAAEAAKEAARMRELAAQRNQDPSRARMIRSEAQDSQNNASKLRTEATELADAARTAERAATAQAEVSRRAMESANAAASTAGLREPFRRENELVTGIDGPRGRRIEDALGADPTITSEVAERTVQADQEFARLAATPHGQQALTQLGIRDGASLRTFGERIARQSESGQPPRATEAPIVPANAQVDRNALATIIRGAGAIVGGEAGARLEDAAFANAVATGTSPREARRQVETNEAGLNDPAVADGMDRLGISEEQVLAAPPEVQAQLTEAARSASAENYQQAITQLAALPAESAELASTAIAEAASHLPPGPARSLLQDREVVEGIAAGSEGAARIAELARGNFVEGLAGLEGSPQRAAAQVLSGEETVRTELSALGFSPEDLVENSEHLQDLLKAGKQLVDGDTTGALQTLQGAGADLLERGLTKLAESLPEGVARNLLERTDTMRAILESPEATGALGALVRGDVGEAVRHLQGPVLDRVLTEVAGDPALKPHLDALGLTPQDLRSGISALPNVLDAARELAAGNPRGAAEELINAAETAPALVEKALRRGLDALNLPAGVARDLLTSQTPNLLRTLVQRSPEALRQVLAGDLEAALGTMASTPELTHQVSDILMRNEGFAAQMAQLGINDAATLRRGGQSLVQLYEASQALEAGNHQEAALLLAEAAATTPEVAQKALQTLVGQWEGAPEVLNTLINDEQVLTDLLQGGAIQHFIRGDFAEGLQAITENRELTTRVGELLIADESIGPRLAQLGLDDPSEIAELGDAAPHVFSALSALESNDVRGAIGHLADAATLLPADLLKEGIRNLAGRWEGAPAVVTALLTDEAVLDGLINNRDALRSIVAGGVEGEGLEQLAQGLEALSTDPALTAAVGRVLLEDPTMSRGLNRLGIDSPEKFAEAGAALPHLVRAGLHAAEGHYREALLSMTDAAEVAPELTQAALLRLGSELGDPMAAIFGNEEAVAGLVGPEGLQSLRHLINGEVSEGVHGLVNNAPVFGAVVDALAQSPAFSRGLSAIGLTAEDLKTAGPAVSSVIQSIESAAAGEMNEALQHLLDAGEESSALIKKGLEKLASTPPLNQSGIAQALLQDDGLIDLIITDPALHDSIGQLMNGEVTEGLQSLLRNEAASGAVVDALLAVPQIQEAMARFDLTREDMVSAGVGLAHFIEGFQILQEDQSKVGEAFATFLEGAQHIPAPALQRMLEKLAPRLPGGENGMVQQLAGNPELLQAIIEDGGAIEGLQQLFRGEINDGIRTLITNPAVATALGTVLLSDAVPAVRDFLNDIGIETPADMQRLLSDSLPDALEAFQAIQEGRIADALGSMGRAVADLPEEMKRNFAQFLTEKLNVPPEFTDIVLAGLSLVGDPEIRAQFGEVLEGFQSGNPAEFVQQLGALGRTVAAEQPEAAIALLNSLKHLPGSIGEFFSDEQLNRAFVESGSINELFTAVEKIAEGDVAGGLQAVVESLIKLMQHGENINLGPWDPLGRFGPGAGPYELPFSEQGLENIGRLITRFVDAMPDQIKDFLKDKLTHVVASAGFRSIPVVGPVVGAAESAVDLFGSISSGDEAFDIAIDAGELLVNAAGLIPGASAITGPLNTLLGTIDAIEDVTDMVSDIQDFGEQFTGMAA